MRALFGPNVFFDHFRGLIVQLFLIALTSIFFLANSPDIALDCGDDQRSQFPPFNLMDCHADFGSEKFMETHSIFKAIFKAGLIELRIEATATRSEPKVEMKTENPRSFLFEISDESETLPLHSAPSRTGSGERKVNPLTGSGEVGVSSDRESDQQLPHLRSGNDTSVDSSDSTTDSGTLDAVDPSQLSAGDRLAATGINQDSRGNTGVNLDDGDVTNPTGGELQPSHHQIPSNTRDRNTGTVMGETRAGGTPGPSIGTPESTLSLSPSNPIGSNPGQAAIVSPPGVGPADGTDTGVATDGDDTGASPAENKVTERGPVGTSATGVTTPSRSPTYFGGESRRSSIGGESDKRRQLYFANLRDVLINEDTNGKQYLVEYSVNDCIDGEFKIWCNFRSVLLNQNNTEKLLVFVSLIPVFIGIFGLLFKSLISDQKSSGMKILKKNFFGNNVEDLPQWLNILVNNFENTLFEDMRLQKKSSLIFYLGVILIGISVSLSVSFYTSNSLDSGVVREVTIAGILPLFLIFVLGGLCLKLSYSLEDEIGLLRRDLTLSQNRLASAVGLQDKSKIKFNEFLISLSKEGILSNSGDSNKSSKKDIVSLSPSELSVISHLVSLLKKS
jgi:hypothetical protein